jgi:hypothetical protein
MESIPPPPVVQYEPISVLPVRLCTVSHCHTTLDADYPYRRCERHRLQNRHHSKLKRVRDKKEKSKAIGSLYTNEPLDLDTRALEIEGAEWSEVCLPFFFSSFLISTSISMRISPTKTPFHLLLVASAVRILCALLSGVRTYSTFAHLGRCVKPIGRNTARIGGADSAMAHVLPAIWTKIYLMKSMKTQW